MEIKFLRKIQNAPQIWSFCFEKQPGLRYDAGDYVELSLLEAGPAGDKRWMSFSSSPTEDFLQFTTKIVDKPSEYKIALSNLSPSSVALVSPAIGTFNLPKDASEKLLFVAAGVGITPYRSMLKYLIDETDHRDIELIYVAKPTDFIFGDVISDASIPVHQTSDRVDFNWIKKKVVDFSERRIYFAGPQPYCEGLFDQALDNGIDRSLLMLDYFEGLTEL